MSPRRTRVSMVACMAFTVSALLFSLLWLLHPSTPTRAQSQPAALGSVSGTVRNAQGEPLADITVELYRQFYEPALRTSTTDTQGKYTLLSVPPGIYKIRFRDAEKTLASVYFPNNAVWSDAETVNVSGNAVMNVDMALVNGGKLAVRIEPALSITDSIVLLTLYGKTQTGRWETFDTINWPTIDTDLIFDGLPDGTYALCAQPYIPQNFHEISECYDNAAFDYSGQPPADAQEIVISNAEEKEILLRFGDFSQLQGVVQSPTGERLANVYISISSSNGGYDWITDVEGRFNFPIRLNEGQYTLQARDGTATFLPTYYDGAATFDKATRLDIDATSRFSLTLTMRPSGRITGKVRLEGGGIPSQVTITPYIPWADGWDGFNGICYIPTCISSYEPATGVYTITGLTTGNYRIGIAEIYNGINYISSYYGGSDLKSAKDIHVTTGKTTPNIDVTLGIGAFEGILRGTVTANNEPAPAVEVGLYTREYYYGQPRLPIVTSTTDAQGNYRFDGLASGAYYLGFFDPQGRYASSMYGGDVFQPETIIITSGMTLGNINGQLTPGSTILGRIVRIAGSNRADFRLFVYDIEIGGLLPNINVKSDTTGNYAITGLQPGTYQVATTNPLLSSSVPLLQFHPREIVLAEGVTISGIDILIDIAPSAFLPIIGIGD